MTFITIKSRSRATISIFINDDHQRIIDLQGIVVHSTSSLNQRNKYYQAFLSFLRVNILWWYWFRVIMQQQGSKWGVRNKFCTGCKFDTISERWIMKKLHHMSTKCFVQNHFTPLLPVFKRLSFSAVKTVSNYGNRMFSRRNVRKSTCGRWTEAKPEKAGRSILKTIKLGDINPTSIF